MIIVGSWGKLRSQIMAVAAQMQSPRVVMDDHYHHPNGVDEFRSIANILPCPRDETQAAMDREEDLSALNATYERRYRFLWLAVAWIMVVLQSAQMFIVMSNMAMDREVTMTPVVVSSIIFGFSVALFAAVYRFVLLPNSRWVPPIVQRWAARVQSMPEHGDKSAVS